MLSDISTLVCIRMAGLPHIDVAGATPVPTFPLSYWRQRAASTELPVVPCAVPTHVVGLRTARKVTSSSTPAQWSYRALFVVLRRMPGAPPSSMARREARLPPGGLHLGSIVEATGTTTVGDSRVKHDHERLRRQSEI